MVNDNYLYQLFIVDLNKALKKKKKMQSIFIIERNLSKKLSPITSKK
jgi:hypothetical protein